MDKHGYKYLPSVSNKFMVDVKRPGGEVKALLEKEKVYVGRVWSSLPNHLRVSIGTQDEMNKFKAAFLKVMA
jgi:histidinol-phosphate aminotransferase